MTNPLLARERAARLEAQKDFERRNPRYIRLEGHPDAELVKWAYRQKVSFPVVVGGVKYVSPGTVKCAKMWKQKLESELQDSSSDHQ